MLDTVIDRREDEADRFALRAEPAERVPRRRLPQRADVVITARQTELGALATLRELLRDPALGSRRKSDLAAKVLAQVLELAASSGPERGDVLATNSELAEAAGLTVAEVRAALDALEAARWIGRVACAAHVSGRAIVPRWRTPQSDCLTGAPGAAPPAPRAASPAPRAASPAPRAASPAPRGAPPARQERRPSHACASKLAFTITNYENDPLVVPQECKAACAPALPVPPEPKPEPERKPDPEPERELAEEPADPVARRWLERMRDIHAKHAQEDAQRAAEPAAAASAEPTAAGPVRRPWSPPYAPGGLSPRASEAATNREIARCLDALGSDTHAQAVVDLAAVLAYRFADHKPETREFWEARIALWGVSAAGVDALRSAIDIATFKDHPSRYFSACLGTRGRPPFFRRAQKTTPGATRQCPPGVATDRHPARMSNRTQGVAS